MSETPVRATYTEPRHVPLWWWFLIVFFVASLGVAVWWYRGVLDALVAAVVAGVVAAVIVIAWGRGPVVVDAEGVRVGPNRITWEWTGEITALDRDATAALLGPEADPRAFLQTRPWLHEAVRLDIADSADPHPYWIIGTRDATALAEAMTRASSDASR